MFATFENGRLQAKLDEYSEVNIEFHQTIIRMSRNRVLIDLAANLFAHMRMIRRKTIGESDRADRSISDHMNIIRAIEARDTARAEAWCATTRSGLPSMSPGMPIISTESKAKTSTDQNKGTSGSLPWLRRR